MKEVIVPADDLVCLGKEKLQEVIRCQDCKHCETMTIFGKTTLYSCIRKNPAVDVLANDYCSKGRRKDES